MALVDHLGWMAREQRRRECHAEDAEGARMIGFGMPPEVAEEPRIWREVNGAWMLIVQASDYRASMQAAEDHEKIRQLVKKARMR